MPLQPLYLAPGICKTASAYASGKTVEYGEGRVALGRYIDSNWIRFLAGFPEQIGAGIYSALSFSNASAYPVGRSFCAWRDLNAVSHLAIGTDSYLFVSDGYSTITDVTPARVLLTGNLSGTTPITTSIGSTEVTVADSSATLQPYDWVYLATSSAINGVSLLGWYSVNTINAGTSYTVISGISASGSGSGGGTTAYQYPRATITNAFSTTSGSSTVTIAYSSHGAFTGDSVTVPLVTNSGNTILTAGKYIVTLVDSSHFTVQSASPQGHTYSNVGGAVQFVFDIHASGLTYNPVGYGLSTYGSGAYGASQTSVPTLVTGWTMDAYGSLLFAAPIGGAIYVYDPVQLGRAYPLLNAPTSLNAMFITPERFVVALAINGSFLELAWCDQNSATTWTSTVTNTAESGRTLQGGSFFTAGIPVRIGTSLFWSNECTFQMAYSGDNNVYDTPIVADQCGIIGPFAAVVYGENAYWMSDTDFWMWNGSVQQLPSDDIRDYVFRSINKTYQVKCVAGLVRNKKEVWFFYPTGSSTENNAYVIFHTDQQCWSIGYIGFSGWLDSDLFTYPFAAMAVQNANGVVTSTKLLQMEQPPSSATTFLPASYITAAPTDISNGDTNVGVFGFIPDFERITQNLNLMITSQYYPEGSTNTDGPYTLSPIANISSRIDLRTDGKLIGFEISSQGIAGTDYRFGLCRVDVMPSGARR